MASKTQLKTREKGSGTVYKDGKRFYLKIRVAGKAKTKMLRNADGTACTKMEQALVAADDMKMILLSESKEEIAFHVAQAKRLKRQSGLTLARAWEVYLEQGDRPDSGPKTLSQYEGIWGKFLAWLRKDHPEITRIGEIGRDTAREYLNDVWKRGITAKTYNAHRQALKLIFRYLVEPAALDENPFNDIQAKPIETVSRKEFTEAQIKQIFDGFNSGFFYETTIEKLGPGRKRLKEKKRLQFQPMNSQEMKVLLHLCCWTGCRGQDGCIITWNCVDFTRNQITYVPNKTARKTNRKSVTLPLHPDLRAILIEAQAWQEKNRAGENYILPAVAKRYKHNPSGVQKDVMKIIRCATSLETTIKNPGPRRLLAANAYSLHSFRHSFVSFCANAGVPLATVSEIVGHGNPAMTRHYSHITTEAKRKAIDALPVLESPISANTPIPQENVKQRLLEAISSADDKQLNKILKILGK
jgi:integrase